MGWKRNLLGFLAVTGIVGYAAFNSGVEFERQRQREKFNHISLEAYNLMIEAREGSGYNQCVVTQSTSLHLITNRSTELFDIDPKTNEADLKKEVAQYLRDVLTEVQRVAEDYHKSKETKDYCK